MDSSTVRTHLVIANIQKRHNVQALIATAIGLGVSTVFIVGQPTLDLDPNSDTAKIPLYLRQALLSDTSEEGDLTDPPRGTARVRRFGKWKECVAYLQRLHIPLVGVEIDKRAITIEELLIKCQPLCHVALVMGNEGQGMSDSQMNDCQYLVRLPQYGAGTASYNVYVAASLVLQRLHQWQTTGT